MNLLSAGLEIGSPVSGVMLRLPPFPRCLPRPGTAHAGEVSGEREGSKVLILGSQVAAPWSLGIEEETESCTKLGSWGLGPSHLLSDLVLSLWLCLASTPRVQPPPTALCVPRALLPEDAAPPVSSITRNASRGSNRPRPPGPPLSAPCG